jgi:hypothetical protein
MAGATPVREKRANRAYSGCTSWYVNATVMFAAHRHLIGVYLPGEVIE